MKRVLTGALVLLSLLTRGARAGLDSGVVEPPEVMRAYAAGGDGASAFNYGVALVKGAGGKPDPAQAAVWFRQSAAAGFAPGQFALGVLLAKGEGVPKDDKEAVKWFAAAGMQGLFEAQKMMMLSFSAGLGVEKSAEKALIWDFIARRTLELRFEQPAGVPPLPAKLRADGFAEYTAPGGQPEALGPDGSVERTAKDGTKTIERPDGGLTQVHPNGDRVTKYSDGRTVMEFPDGRQVTRDRNGTVETKNPDGSRELEGEGTMATGRKVRFTDRFAKDGTRISRRVIDGDQIIEELPDGAHLVETAGQDEQGRKVRVIERVEKDGARGPRRLVREDGVERQGEEFWVVTRNVRQLDGRVGRVKQKFGFGNSIYDEQQLAAAEVATPAREAEQPERKGLPISREVVAMERVVGTRTIPERQPLPFKNEQPILVIPRRGQDTGPIRVLTSASPRVKVPIDKQLADLAEIERVSRYFAGATAAQWESARVAAQRFVFELPQPPQKPPAVSGPAPRFALRGSPPPLPGFVRLAADRAEQFPLGLHGRAAIKLHSWQHTETEHFVVHYTDPKVAYSVMGDIECTFLNVTQTLQLDPTSVRQKSHVFIFPDAAAWRAFKEPLGLPEAVAGFAYKSELYLGVPVLREQYLRILCHEAAHAVVARYYPARKWPLWLNEGFAEYMSSKQREIQLNAKPDPKAPKPVRWQIEIDRVFDRAAYAIGSPKLSLSNGVQIDSTVLFYLEAERCARTLLEKLPPAGFPRFANLLFAGNPPGVSLRAAYGNACASTEQFQALVNQQ